MTFASGKQLFESREFWVYINSLKNIPNADHVILTHDMDSSVRDRLFDKEIEVVDVPAESIHFLYRDRHLAFRNYLNDHGHKYKYVLVTDSRDVMFQANPFDWIPEWKARFTNIKGKLQFLDHFVILTAEGFKIEKSGFACIEHFEFQRDVPRPYLKEDKNRWVINGGVAMGTPQAMMNFHFLVWSLTLKTIGRCTDQATINWLMYYLDDDDTYSVSFPQHDNLCLTGEGVKEGAVEPILKGNILMNAHEKPYCMVHQWDRLEHFRDAVLAHYV